MEQSKARPGARAVHCLPDIEYLSYVCAEIRRLYHIIQSYDGEDKPAIPPRTLERWLQTVYDAAIE